MESRRLDTVFTIEAYLSIRSVSERHSYLGRA